MDLSLWQVFARKFLLQGPKPELLWIEWLRTWQSWRRTRPSSLRSKKTRRFFEIPDTQKIDWTCIFIYLYKPIYIYHKNEPKCRWKKTYIECLGIRKNMAMAKLPNFHWLLEVWKTWDFFVYLKALLDIVYLLSHVGPWNSKVFGNLIYPTNYVIPKGLGGRLAIGWVSVYKLAS